MKTPTYVDSGVLLAAMKPSSVIHSAALSVLGDPERILMFSVFVELETLPLAIAQKRGEEEAFLRHFFASAVRLAPPPDIYARSIQEACNDGLQGMDSMHIATALAGGAIELVTSENRRKLIHRTTSIRTISLYDFLQQQVA